MDPASPADVGFAQVCYQDGGRTLTLARLRPDGAGSLASLSFAVPVGVDDIEFRVFVNNGVKAKLRHVVLKQQR